jgi:hypothetical protein
MIDEEDILRVVGTVGERNAEKLDGWRGMVSYVNRIFLR